MQVCFWCFSVLVLAKITASIAQQVARQSHNHTNTSNLKAVSSILTRGTPFAFFSKFICCTIFMPKASRSNDYLTIAPSLTSLSQKLCTLDLSQCCIWLMLYCNYCYENHNTTLKNQLPRPFRAYTHIQHRLLRKQHTLTRQLDAFASRSRQLNQLGRQKCVLPGGESNPGLPRDRRGYLPLDYRGHDVHGQYNMQYLSHMPSLLIRVVWLDSPKQYRSTAQLCNTQHTLFIINLNVMFWCLLSISFHFFFFEWQKKKHYRNKRVHEH